MHMGCRKRFMVIIRADETSHNVASHLGLRCLRLSYFYGGLFVPFRYFVLLSFRLALWRGAKTK